PSLFDRVARSLAKTIQRTPSPDTVEDTFDSGDAETSLFDRVVRSLDKTIQRSPDLTEESFDSDVGEPSLFDRVTKVARSTKGVEKSVQRSPESKPGKNSERKAVRVKSPSSTIRRSPLPLAKLRTSSNKQVVQRDGDDIDTSESHVGSSEGVSSSG